MKWKQFMIVPDLVNAVEKGRQHMNGYNFNFAVSATISERVVKEMITRVVEEQTGKKVSTVEMNMKTVSKGSYRDEYTETVFEGATVYFEGA
jgi:hypothetical protein